MGLASLKSTSKKDGTGYGSLAASQTLQSTLWEQDVPVRVLFNSRNNSFFFKSLLRCRFQSIEPAIKVPKNLLLVFLSSWTASKFLDVSLPNGSYLTKCVIKNEFYPIPYLNL